MDAKLNTLIKRLLERTITKQLSWEPTTRKTEFRTRFDHGSITVDKWAFTDEDGQEHDAADMVLFNPQGEKIDGVVADRRSDPADYRTIGDLHDAARRLCLRVEETIDHIIDEIGKLDTAKLKILSARYGKKEKVIDVAQALRARVKNDALDLIVGNDLAGDPFEGVGKELVVRYNHAGLELEVKVPEGQRLKIP